MKFYITPLAILSAACKGGTQDNILLPATKSTQSTPIRIGVIYNLTGGQASLDTLQIPG